MISLFEKHHPAGKHACLLFRLHIEKALPFFPPLDIHTCFDTGQTMATERKKTLSTPESACFPEMTKGEK